MDTQRSKDAVAAICAAAEALLAEARAHSLALQKPGSCVERQVRTSIRQILVECEELAVIIGRRR